MKKDEPVDAEVGEETAAGDGPAGKDVRVGDETPANQAGVALPWRALHDVLFARLVRQRDRRWHLRA